MRILILILFISLILGVIGLLLPPSPDEVRKKGLKSGKLRKCLHCGAVASAAFENCPDCKRPLPDIIDAEIVK